MKPNHPSKGLAILEGRDTYIELLASLVKSYNDEKEKAKQALREAVEYCREMEERIKQVEDRIKRMEDFAPRFDTSAPVVAPSLWWRENWIPARLPAGGRQI